MDGFELAKKLEENINSVFVGREEVVENLLVCLLGGGHVLLEDVPGVGKTTLAKTLARSMECSFGRIQFTPDTLPGDVVGVSVYNGKTCEFEYRSGGVMTQILLADEINRTAPKTQASLLEAMAEGQVTVDGTVHGLPRPFMVIATQNPVETAGTFPLPEAQLDRFMMKLSMGLPSREDETFILERYMDKDPLSGLSSVLTLDELAQAEKEAEKVFVHPCIRSYIVDISAATRTGEQVIMGASPRGSLALMRCAKAYAWLEGRSYVIPDDIKILAVPVLAHRLVLGYGAGGSGSAKMLIQKLLDTLPVPTEDFAS